MVATGTGAPGGAVQATTPTTGGTNAGGTDPTPQDPGTVTPTTEQLSANTLIRGWLERYGLAALGDWAWQKILNGESYDQIVLEIPETEAFKTRFPAYAEVSAYQRDFTVNDYIAYEQHIASLSSQYGIPLEMYGTREGIAGMLVNNISTNEATQRFQIAAAASYAAPREVKDAITALYGVGEGAFIAYYLDPEKAMPILERQWAASQVAGAASQQQMSANVAEAERLASLGITFDEARRGYGQANSLEGLGAGGITRDDRVAAAFGDAEAQRRIQRAQQTRTADFAGGGGAIESQQGVGGLLGAGTT